MPTSERMSIKDYVDLMRGQGQAPAFTNVAGQTGQFSEQNAYVIPEYQQVAGRGFAPGEEPQTSPVGGAVDVMGGRVLQPGPAMPPRQEEQQEVQVDEKDPWSLANAALPAMLDELRAEMFPDKVPGERLSPSEWKQFASGAKSIRNALVDRFKWQIDRRDELEKERRDKRSKAGIKQADILKLATSLSKNYDPMNELGESQTEYIRRMIDEITDLAAEMAPISDKSGGVIPAKGEKAPTGQEKAPTGQEKVSGAAPRTTEDAKKKGMTIKRIGKYQGKNVVQIGENYFLEDPNSKTLTPVNITR